MSNKPKERVQGCRLPYWLPQGTEQGRYVGLFPYGQVICREKQTGKTPKPKADGTIVRFKRELCQVKANFRQVELVPISGKFPPYVMQYSAFLMLELPVYTKPIASKAAKAAKPKASKVHRLSKAEAGLIKLNRVRNLAKSGQIAPAEAERLLR